MRNATLALSVQKLYGNYFLLGAVIVLILVYFFEVTSLGTKGFEIKQLEQQIRVLEQTQKDLQIQASDLQSINRIQAQAAKLNFVPSTNVTYLKASDFALK
jgi:cell division protein FtsL